MPVARLNYRERPISSSREIYVFVGKGALSNRSPVQRLSTFYAVHTDIGHARVGARVDRQPYSSQPLTSGQTVEITRTGCSPECRVAELCR